MAECTLMLDYLPFTLAYVSLCSLLTKVFTADILLSPQE